MSMFDAVPPLPNRPPGLALAVTVDEHANTTDDSVGPGLEVSQRVVAVEDVMPLFTDRNGWRGTADIQASLASAALASPTPDLRGTGGTRVVAAPRRLPRTETPRLPNGVKHPPLHEFCLGQRVRVIFEGRLVSSENGEPANSVPVDPHAGPPPAVPHQPMRILKVRLICTEGN